MICGLSIFSDNAIKRNVTAAKLENINNIGIYGLCDRRRNDKQILINSNNMYPT